MCRIQFALDSSELHAKCHIPIKAWYIITCILKKLTLSEWRLN
jgi:hypothetical protein